jgi:hypothetical protein
VKPITVNNANEIVAQTIATSGVNQGKGHAKIGEVL